MVPNRTVRVMSLLALAVAAYGLTGCHVKTPPPPKQATATKVVEQRDGKIADQRDGKAADQRDGKAVAQRDGKAADAEAVVGPPVLRDKIAANRAVGLQTAIRLPGIRSSKPHTTKEAALTDALTVGRTELMKQLEQLDSPIHGRPWLVKMKSEYVKGEVRVIPPTDKEKELIKASGLNANVQWVEVDLELTEDQVQQLRSTERVTDTFRIGALVVAFLAAVYGFLRLDQWTKGYLTLWLGLAAGLAVGGVAMLVLG